MADQGAGATAVEVRPLLDAAVEELDADAARVGRVLRTIRSDGKPTVPLAVFTAIATSRRHTYGWFGKVLKLDTQDPAKGVALNAFSSLGAGLGAWYQALRSTDPATQRKQQHLADERFAAAAMAFTQLRTMLGRNP